MMKKSLVGLVVFACLGLSACSVNFEKDGVHINKENIKQSHKEKSKTSKKTEKAEVKTKKAKKRKKVNSLWTKNQDQELEQYMRTWSKQMGQVYTKYEGKKITTSVGSKYPDVLRDRKFVLNKKVISISWNQRRDKKDNYNVVAIYNDNFKKQKMHFTYLFTIKNKHAFVLVEQGRDENPLILYVSSNKQLTKKFSQIVKTNHN
ncbi:DUF4767 domain-containing protein [Lactobacillus agrestimuris]|uniref:DUF4767 domain-containing protein n=1 Tax=Lactobacillus agrestimuris TaxID=2941328 RepID=UPI0020440860|nr:DUF4767 domain-containing protein [Lactobacillus agrestimuris]